MPGYSVTVKKTKIYKVDIPSADSKEDAISKALSLLNGDGKNYVVDSYKDCEAEEI